MRIRVANCGLLARALRTAGANMKQTYLLMSRVKLDVSYRLPLARYMLHPPREQASAKG